MKLTIAIALLAGLVPLVAEAQQMSDFRCVVERVYAADESIGGFMDFERKKIGTEFTVDRQSGVMAGSLKNAYVSRPEVIDYGQNGNSYKVVTTMRADPAAGRPGSTVFTLVVNSYLDSPVKPFVFLSVDSVYFGSCRAF